MPIALEINLTTDIRKLMASGSNLMPGSTINFDEITKGKIFEAINNANMSKFVDLKKDYFSLKNKIGRVL